MIQVRIETYWDCSDIIRQTPGGKGIWEDILFTFNPVEECDYLIILNQLPRDIHIKCPSSHIWQLVMEPPNLEHASWHFGDKRFARTYTTDERLQKLFGKRYHVTQPALPWYVKQGYDDLQCSSVPWKKAGISCVTSNKRIFSGHKKRLEFIDNLKNDLQFDLYGRGFNEIEDKMDALLPYQYSIAIENFQNNFYWTEKLSDCFLAYTMPIYFGARNITDYFPKESMVIININKPKEALLIIKDAIASSTYERNLDAIKIAREFVLNKYQIFPFLANEIHKHELDKSHTNCIPENISLTKDLHPPLIQYLIKKLISFHHIHGDGPMKSIRRQMN